jgi:uncharacterized membrane protein HdeD (DUF308 family)
MEVDGFLIGVIALSSMVAAVYFFKFWRKTGDSFFLLFATSFFIEGCNRTAVLSLSRPNEGSPYIYMVRLFAFLLILVAIVRKNYGNLK